MGLCKFTCAIITRGLFVLVSLAGVWRVTWVKKDPNYWLLTFLFLPLVLEMIITLKRRRGEDYKWFSPPIFMFLISIIPSIWLLELHHQQLHHQPHNASETQVLHNRNKKLLCKNIDYEAFMMNDSLGNSSHLDYMKRINETLSFMSSFCSNVWILALHQILLILLIVGKWLLPLGGGVTRDELSQLLLIFIGTAADILEFTSETVSDIKETSSQMVYIILGVWTWSMLQFPLHLAVVASKPDSDNEQGVQETSLLAKHSRDVWSIVEALFIQDGPFLVVRLIVMMYYKVFHQMLGFFAIKNFLVVILNLYRLVVICQDSRPSSSSRDTDLP
ncbi:transmembrane protein 26-like [Hippoglossus hippoglossus]|uniref:transmembrane protein 26-like n=1 Tax=Hippoglossus hippoglossus TaxID=8267 RepID=UPI00148CFD35|nr:transmembrane protein 26-like [Hippoglossus hippoglossus]